MKIWLDDQREPPDESWIWVDSPNAFVGFVDKAVSEGRLEAVSFDHDLGICPDGYRCALWLCLLYELTGDPLPKLSCHSQNPVGRERIERLIAEAR